MIKHPKRRFEKTLNLAHRYFVYTSIAFTLITTGFIGVRFYHHYKFVQEQKKLHTVRQLQQQQQQEDRNVEDPFEKFANIDDVPKKIATSNF